MPMVPAYLLDMQAPACHRNAERSGFYAAKGDLYSFVLAANETVISLATEAEHSPAIITLQLIRVTIIMLLAGYLVPIINFLTRRR